MGGASRIGDGSDRAGRQAFAGLRRPINRTIGRRTPMAALGVCGGRCGRGCAAYWWRTAINVCQRPTRRLRRGFVRSRRRRRGVSIRGRGSRLGNKLFNGHDLFPITEFLQLAQQGLDLFNQSLALGAFDLTEDLLCRAMSAVNGWRQANHVKTYG